MTQSPTSFPDPPQDGAGSVATASAGNNPLGIAGFITAIVGWVTCGLLCPIGLILSLFALGKPPRGFAIAGAIIGAVGSLFLLVVGLGIILAALGIGAAASMGFGGFMQEVVFTQTGQAVVDHYNDHNQQLPTQAEFDQIVQTQGIQAHGQAPRYNPMPEDPRAFEITLPGADGQFDTADDVSRTFNVDQAIIPQFEFDVEDNDPNEPDAAGEFEGTPAPAENDPTP